MKNKSTALYIISCIELFSSLFVGTDQALAILALGVATYVYARVSRLEELLNLDAGPMPQMEKKDGVE